MIKLSVGEAYLPQDKGNGEDSNRLTSSLSVLSTGGHSRLDGLKNVFPYLGSSRAQYSQSSGDYFNFSWFLCQYDYQKIQSSGIFVL